MFIKFGIIMLLSTIVLITSNNYCASNDGKEKIGKAQVGEKIEILSGEKLARQFYSFAKGNEKNENYQQAIKYYQDSLDVLVDDNQYETETNILIIEAVTELEVKLGKQIYFEKSKNYRKYCYAYFYNANLARSKKDYKKAIVYLLHAKEYYPELTETYNNLGIMYDLTGDYSKAIHVYKEALKYKKNDPDIYYNIACSYSLQKNEKESIAHLKLALKYGFNDYESIKNDDTLSFIKNSEEYKKIISGK